MLTKNFKKYRCKISNMLNFTA